METNVLQMKLTPADTAGRNEDNFEQVLVHVGDII